jgi:hypothetical protein
MFCIKIPTRFVPFARAESRPRKMSIGKVREEPPPAPTLMNPDMNAITNKIIIEVISDTIKSCFFEMKYTTPMSYVKKIIFEM